MTFEIGEKIGPYRIVESIGQGGMATVYKAYHARLDRYVAIKVLHPALKQDPSFLERFQREARLIARLEHPNIVPVYDFSEYKGNPYLVMRFIEGKTLKARLKEGPLSLVQTAQIVQSVGSALSYAHKEGILHRDIKPSNIMLAKDGNIYLADFGLARMVQSSESTISRDMIVGTPHYVSPEQARGDSELDARTDIYSLGVVIYELVVGKVPFTADTPYAIVHDHIYTPLPMPREVNPDVPESIERVLFKALAKKPEERYSTVDEMVAAFLDAVEKADIGEAEPLPRTEPTFPRSVLPDGAAGPTQEVNLSRPEATLAVLQTGDQTTLPPVQTKAFQAKRRRGGGALWAVGGLILLVITILVGGLHLGRVIREEYNHVFREVQSEGSFLFEESPYAPLDVI